MIYSMMRTILLFNMTAWSTLCMLLLVIPAVYVAYWVWYGITRNMAQKRNRDPLGWILLSLFISPIWVWIILLLIGKKNEEVSRNENVSKNEENVHDTED